jgi:hypothetical protein
MPTSSLQFACASLLYRRPMPVGKAEKIDPRAFAVAMTLPVWQAMAAVRWLEGRVRNRPKAAEATPAKAALTDGDCVSQEILLVALREHFPRVELFVEEDTPSVSQFARNRADETVVIDPIDGTLRYLRGDGMYAILVGLERGRQVEAALVALPQTGTLIRAVRGQGAEIARSGGDFAPARLGGEGSQLLVSAGLPEEIGRRLSLSGLRLLTAAGGAIGVAPLLPGICGGLRIMEGSEGLSRRAWVACLATLEAGGCVEALDGPFPARHQRGVRGLVIAPSTDGIARLREALRTAA